MFAVLKYGAELRSIYRFYSRLGRAQSPYSLFQLTRLQLWRLLKDCYMHHHFTLIQIDQLIRVEGESPPYYPLCIDSWSELDTFPPCVCQVKRL